MDQWTQEERLKIFDIARYFAGRGPQLQRASLETSEKGNCINSFKKRVKYEATEAGAAQTRARDEGNRNFISATRGIPSLLGIIEVLPRKDIPEKERHIRNPEMNHFAQFEMDCVAERSGETERESFSQFTSRKKAWSKISTNNYQGNREINNKL